MRTSAQNVSLTLKLIGLMTASVVLGIHWGRSAIGEIDPFYYQTRTSGSRYVAEQRQTSVEPSHGDHAYPDAYAYPKAYAYSPAPPLAAAMEARPWPSAESFADGGGDVEAYSDMDLSSPSAASDADAAIDCANCGGPYEAFEAPPPETAEPATADEGASPANMAWSPADSASDPPP